MITQEEIRKIAKLAKLYVSEEEIGDLTEDMARIIAFADTINAAADTQEPFDSIQSLQNALREDVVRPSYPQEEILRNVNGGEDGYFRTKQSREG